MAWVHRRNPNGSGYVIVDSDTGEPYGGRSARVYGSEREAQDAIDQERAWESVSGGDPENNAEAGQSLADEMGAAEQRRFDSTDPAARQRALDEGRPMSGGYSDPYADDSSGQASDFDEGSADVPVWGWLSGAQARRDAARAESEADRAESGWDALSDYMPTANDLAVDYEQSEYAAGPERSELGQARADEGAISQQRYTMDALRQIAASGGMTDADRAQQAQARERTGMALRAQREADASMLAARGMGGSGAQIASLISGQQAGAQALSSADAQMQIEAQRRRDAALSALGGIAGDVRGQSFSESATRGSAIDDLNMWNSERRQRWYEDNTDRRNQGRESRSQARQQGYENRERQQAGRTNQWTSAASGRRQDQARQDAANQAGASALGSLIEEIL